MLTATNGGHAAAARAQNALTVSSRVAPHSASPSSLKIGSARGLSSPDGAVSVGASWLRPSCRSRLWALGGGSLGAGCDDVGRGGSPRSLLASEGVRGAGVPCVRFARAGEDGAVSRWAPYLYVGTGVLHVRRERTGRRGGVDGRLWDASLLVHGRLCARPLCRSIRGVCDLGACLCTRGEERRLGGRALGSELYSSGR